MFSRFKKSKKPVAKKMTAKKTVPNKPEKKQTSQRVITAEGWKRMMLKKKKG